MTQEQADAFLRPIVLGGMTILNAMISPVAAEAIWPGNWFSRGLVALQILFCYFATIFTLIAAIKGCGDE
jgi:hypothetical protein